MAILEKEVTVNVDRKTANYYESLGHKIEKYIDRRGVLRVKRQTIIAKVECLPEGSSIKLDKICDICLLNGVHKIIPKQPYYRIISSRKNNSDGRDYCDRCAKNVRGETRKNNLKYEKSIEYMAIKNNLDYLLNEFSTKNTRKSNEISYGSTTKYMWNCAKCDSEFLMSPVKRVSGLRNCPYCSGQKANNTNCLLITHPNIAKEWHPTKNGSLTPIDTTKGTNKIVWWLCPECKSEYDMPPSTRTGQNQKCPYCKGLRINQTNSLDSLYPQISIEWNVEKNGNLTPQSIAKTSNKKVWWKCRQCDYEWESAVSNRVNGGNGCPQCNESKGEKIIDEFLTKNLLEYLIQSRFEDCRYKSTLPFDFSILDLNKNLICLIEYDGEHHFKPVQFGGISLERAEKNFKLIQKKDIIKNNYCKLNNIPLLRIPYWDIGNIEEILTNELIKLNINIAM